MGPGHRRHSNHQQNGVSILLYTSTYSGFPAGFHLFGGGQLKDFGEE